jgi:hypothetical protein
MLQRTLGFALAAALPLTAMAQSGDRFQCMMGGNVRRVEIFYETGAAVPCEVQYFKDSEAPGQREVLWRAQNQSGYCEARAREFIMRLESLGFECMAEAGVSDDTDVLRPADD